MAQERNLMKRPTRNDVAALANVSGCTVSYVLGGRKDVVIADATRARVLAAARQLGYRPNGAARALVTGSTRVVSLLAGCLTPYYTMLTSHLRVLAKESGYQVLISDSDVRQDGDTAKLWTGDGILAIDYPEHIDAYLQTHPDLRTPLVSIGAFHLEQVDHVGVDLYGGARAAIDHLVDIGCRRIAYAHSESPWHLRDPRVLGYEDAMRAADLPDEQIILSDHARSVGRRAIREYIADHGCPEGLLCHNDETAIGIYRGLCDLGIRVPDDVKLVGCDGIEDTDYLECPITTIRQPVDQMCRTGWEFLLKRMADPSIPLQKKVFDTELVIKGSTVPPPTRSTAEPKEAHLS